MTSELSAVGELIAFGLDPRTAPGRHAHYADLVTRFRTNSEFRQQVEVVAQGQGLDILDCSPVYGLVLTACGADSPYRMRLDDYGTMTPDERLLNAFVFLAIATASYPSSESLESEDGPLPQITVAQVLRLINRLAERLRDQSVDGDPPLHQPELEPLYRLVLRWREGDTTGDERSNPHVKSGMVRRALKWLAANGFAEEIATAKDAYRIRSRFRLHVKDAIGHVGDALAQLRQVASSRDAL